MPTTTKQLSITNPQQPTTNVPSTSTATTHTIVSRAITTIQQHQNLRPSKLPKQMTTTQHTDQVTTEPSTTVIQNRNLADPTKIMSLTDSIQTIANQANDTIHHNQTMSANGQLSNLLPVFPTDTAILSKQLSKPPTGSSFNHSVSRSTTDLTPRLGKSPSPATRTQVIQPTADGKYRYKAIVTYDGRWFSGWQRQTGQLSVQEVLESALTKLANHPIQLTVAGRTDAGVHALGQTMHFDFPKLVSEFRLVSGINHYIRQFFIQAKQQLLASLTTVPQGILFSSVLATITQPIAVISCHPVAPTFNSRFDSHDKTYLYRIFTRRYIDPLEEGRGWHLWSKLDPVLMQQAGNILLGEHDFSSFRDSNCQAKTPYRCINSLTVTQHQDLLEITINGNAFLHHMVRNIVGTLQLFGSGKLQPAQMQQILAAKDRRCAGPTAPACGLYLVEVHY